MTTGAMDKYWRLELEQHGFWHTGHPLTVRRPRAASAAAFAAPHTYLLPDGNDQTIERPDIVPGVPVILPGAGTTEFPLIRSRLRKPAPVDLDVPNVVDFWRVSEMPPNGLIRALR